MRKVDINIKELISKKISFQQNVWSPIDKEVSIGEVIKTIKRGRYANEVNKLRWYLKNDEKDKYNMYKEKLPGVTFSANFNGKRKKEFINTYHQLIVLDIDKLDNDELKKVKEILNSEDYVFTYWVSPSEMGIKGLMYIDYQFSIENYGVDTVHSYAFQKIKDYFSNKYSVEIDGSGRDTTRLCFLSYDPNLVFKSIIIPFKVEASAAEISKISKKQIQTKKDAIKYVSSIDVLNNPEGKNNKKNRKTLNNIINFLKKKNISITSPYEDWYRVAYAIANSFTHNIGEKYFLSLCELDGIYHNEIQCKNMLLYCYQNSKGKINFNTIVFLAKQKGFKVEGKSR